MCSPDLRCVQMFFWSVLGWPSKHSWCDLSVSSWRKSICQCPCSHIVYSSLQSRWCVSQLLEECWLIDCLYLKITFSVSPNSRVHFPLSPSGISSPQQLQRRFFTCSVKRIQTGQRRKRCSMSSSFSLHTVQSLPYTFLLIWCRMMPVKILLY